MLPASLLISGIAKGVCFGTTSHVSPPKRVDSEDYPSQLAGLKDPNE